MRLDVEVASGAPAEVRNRADVAGLGDTQVANNRATDVVRIDLAGRSWAPILAGLVLVAGLVLGLLVRRRRSVAVS